MNYFIDFEASQFSERIISIGCVNSNGDEFYTLVHPMRKKKVKVGKYVEKLTGITDADLATAPDTDQALLMFQAYIQRTSNHEETFFFVYGDSDVNFLGRSCYDAKIPQIKKFGNHLLHSLINYAEDVNTFFKINGIRLKRVIEYIHNNEIEQAHNALEDAKMLKEVYDYIQNNDSPDVSPWQAEIDERKRKQEEAIAKNAELALENMGMLRAYNDTTQLLFANATEAISYVIANYVNDTNVIAKNILTRIKQAIKNESLYCTMMWEKVNETD